MMKDELETACESFKKAVKKQIAKLVKRRQQKHGFNLDEERRVNELIRECNRCTNHANYALKTLHAKRISLGFALEAFEQSTDDCIKRIKSTKSLKQVDFMQQQRHILRYWFGIFLRLRDGFVLLESGERRHPGDIDSPFCTKSQLALFKSRLAGGFRPDGKTRKYSSEKGYTGASWDEIFDEDVGIKRRLMDALTRLYPVLGSGGGEVIWDNLLNSGGAMWDFAADDLINGLRGLREKIRTIRNNFEYSVNEFLMAARNKEKSLPSKLSLVTDDKAERLIMGPLEIRREGNVFTLNDKGGSLPIGLTRDDWSKMFAFDAESYKGQRESKPRSKKNQSISAVSREETKKRKRFIIDDDDEDSDEEHEVIPQRSKATKTTKSPQIALSPPNPDKKDNDGLMVTVRDTTKYSPPHDSLNAIKEKMGVSASRLEDGIDHLNREQQQSSFFAEEEDVLEGFLGDEIFHNLTTLKSSGERNSLKNVTARHLQSFVKNWIKFWRELYSSAEREGIIDDCDLREVWEDLRELLSRWKETLKDLVSVYTNISKGCLEESSDEVYQSRENSREVNMHLGSLLIEIGSKLSTLNKQLCQKVNSAVAASLSVAPSLSICAAEESFCTALALVEELESSQPTSSEISNIWIKGQHLLLSGRAHTNIGASILELFQSGGMSSALNTIHRHRNMAQLSKALNHFNKAIASTGELRKNAMAIMNNANAKSISIYNAGRTWASEAVHHSYDAIELRSLASRHCGTCLWKLDRINEAKNVLLNAVSTSDLFELVDREGLKAEVIFGALCEGYWSAMLLAELSTHTWESISFLSKSELAKGEEMVLMMSDAMKRAAQISEDFHSFAKKFSLDDSINKYSIATRDQIEKEEESIREVWNKRKNDSKKKVMNVSRPPVNLPRKDVVGDIRNRGDFRPQTRRIFVRDDNGFSSRSRRRKKGEVERNRREEKSVVESFHAEFCSEERAEHSTITSSTRMERQSTKKIEYRKWGDEIQDDNDAKMYPGCCPPLPPDMPADLRASYEAKYAAILPNMSESDVMAFYACVNRK